MLASTYSEVRSSLSLDDELLDPDIYFDDDRLSDRESSYYYIISCCFITFSGEANFFDLSTVFGATSPGSTKDFESYFGWLFRSVILIVSELNFLNNY